MCPDEEIEQFWYYFKNSMNNFYKSSQLPIRPIEIWSKNLNNLQSKKDYNNINHCIKLYMTLYAIDIMRQCDDYHTNIFKSNIKRWNNIYLNKEIFTDDCKIVYTNEKTFIFFKIFTKLLLYNTYSLELNKKIKDIYNNIELYIFYEYNNYDEFIELSILLNRSCIIELLNNLCDIRELIRKKYNLEIDNNINYLKILKKIKFLNNQK